MSKPATLLTRSWMLGFVSMLMGISSERIHSLLPLYLVGTLWASDLMVGIIEGLGESIALMVRLFPGALSLLSPLSVRLSSC